MGKEEKIINIYLSIFIFIVCVCVYVSRGQEKALNSLELE